MEKFKSKLIDFIDNSTCSYTCCKEIKKVLDNNGFIELDENDEWDLSKGDFYVIRNSSSIIAFTIPENYHKYFSVITTHLDTPSISIKPNSNFVKENYLKLNITPYGGLLNYGWFDHKLSMAGRIVKKEGDLLKVEVVDYKKPIAIIPSVAIHQNSRANTNLEINTQVDMQALISISNNKELFNDLVGRDVIDYDLYLYNTDKPVIMGINNELLISPRIDNLTSTYSALFSFIESNSKSIKVFSSFNSEEIGSLTEEGADSNFLIDIIKRITASLNIDLVSTLSRSIIISSDNTHAIHPNHSELSDDTSKLYLDKGFAIIKESNTTTNAISSSIVQTICDKNNIKYQISTSRNDINGGSTLSTISLRHMSVLSIDVGVGELSMHSSIETCSINDIYSLYQMMKCFYNSLIIIDNDSIKIE